MKTRTPAGFWSLWTTVALDLLGFGVIIPLLPLYADGFDASPATIGFLLAAYSLAQFVMAPIWGRLSDKVGRKPVLLVTLAGSGVGSLILALAGSIPMLFFGRILDGASGASVAVARASIADIASEADRPRLMGLLGAAFGFGFVFGPVIGSLAVLGGPRLPFVVTAVLAVANFISTLIRLPETRGATAVVTSTGAQKVQVSGLVKRLLLITFVGLVAFSGFEAVFALFAVDRLATSPSVVALLFTFVGVVLTVTQAALIAPLSRRLGESGLIRFGLAVNVAAFVVLTMAHSIPTLGAALAALAFGQGLLTPALSSALAGAVEEHRSGAVLGLQHSAGGLARVVGPAMGGVLYGISQSVPFALAAVLGILALALAPRGTPLPVESHVPS